MFSKPVPFLSMNIRIIPLVMVFFGSSPILPAQTDGNPIGPAPAGGATTTLQGSRGPAAFPPNRGGAATPANLGPPLKDNVAVSVKGTFSFDTPIDFTCTGVGPQMIKDGPVDQAPIAGTIMSFKGKISETATGYFLEFSLGLRVPIVNSSTNPPNPLTSTITYRNVAFQSSVNLKPGQPVTVLDDNGKTIVITLTKADAP